ncbi:glycosyltransferase [Pseudofrankia sp. DC12]|uniref:glycosyltransferase n=1 Tax=Pseudofrankia sp. DC12 TaxID=683315 RepID=UPI0005F827ED|nr:glycosyltransferase [Pseudofrankia sp. DC12]
MKVAIGAFACGPGGGSEPGAGWEWTRAAALRHDVWVFTDPSWIEPIRAAVRAEPELRLTAVEVPAPAWANYPGDFGRGERMRYAAWQYFLRRAVRAKHAEIGFDITHHITYAADWMPSGVVLPDVPFVWGPVGGTAPLPSQFREQLGDKQFAVEVARGVITAAGRVACGELLSRRASVMLAANEDVARRFRRAHPRVEPNIALHLDQLPVPAAAPGHGTRPGPDRAPAGAHPEATAVEVGRPEAPGGAKPQRRAVFAGRLLAWKGVRLAVAAIARAHADGWTLDIYGAGPDEEQIRAACERLGVTDRVTLHGQRPREEVLAALASSDVLLFPSMHDSAGWIVAEALALGRPVICLDIGGPAMQVGEVSRFGMGQRGVRVRPYGDVVGALARALRDCPGPLEPDRRFSVERLPDLLDEIYVKAAR